MGNLSRKIFLFILLLLFGCVSSSTVSAQNETESHITKSIIANEIEYELTRYLDSHNFSKNDLNITETIEYGGSYIDSNGTFHFLIEKLTDRKSNFVYK